MPRKKFPYLLNKTTKLCTALLLGAGLSLSACSGYWGEKDNTPPLQGERISVLELEETLEPSDAKLEVEGLVTPEPWKNAFWPQAGGYPNHSMQNLKLSDKPLQKVWSASIGKGHSDGLPLTAQPVLVDGHIFTLDTKNELRKFDAKTGKVLWSLDVRAREEDDNVIGGGLSYSGGILYITNGYNEILAIDAENSKTRWRKKIPAPSRGAPTIMDNRVFVITLDNRVLALSTTDGSVLWEYQGVNEMAGLVGASSPAANRDIVVAAFSSGEVTALRVENGSVAWSDNLSGLRGFGGLAGLSDIKALPVLDRGLVMAISFGGRMVAIEERSGRRVWQREIGSSNTPWVAGNQVFVLTANNQLTAMGRETGVIRWVTEIRDPSGGKAYFTGPVLAGGRLFLAGTDGIVIEVDPENGKQLRAWDTGETVTISPIVANETLYLLSKDGKLNAYK